MSSPNSCSTYDRDRFMYCIEIHRNTQFISNHYVNSKYQTPLLIQKLGVSLGMDAPADPSLGSKFLRRLDSITNDDQVHLSNETREIIERKFSELVRDCNAIVFSNR